MQVFRFVVVAYQYLQWPFSRQGLCARSSVLLLFLSTLLLYSSTSIYMCALVWNRLSVSQIVAQATNGIASSTYDASGSIGSLERVVNIQSWMMTIAAGTNVRIYLSLNGAIVSNLNVVSSDHYWRCGRMVARLRSLAQESRLLYRTSPLGFDPRFDMTTFSPLERF